MTAFAPEDARLSIEITSRCNSACVHCFAGADKYSRAEIPVELVRDIIFEGIATGYRHLHITGGEPLLYAGLFDALDWAVAAGYETILLNTNGTLLERPMCQQLAEYPGLAVTISLEGNEALHDGFRGKGSYRKAVRGLTIGLEAGLDMLVFMIACKSVLSDLPRIADGLFARFPGIQYLTLCRLLPPMVEHPVLHNEYLAPDDFRALVRTVAVLNLIDRPTVLMNEPLINVLAKMLDLPWVPKSNALCRRGNLMISADLRLRMSHTGRALDTTYASGMISTVLSSDAYVQAVAPDMMVCPRCRYSELCRSSGLDWPVEMLPGVKPAAPFCSAVLAGAARQKDRFVNGKAAHGGPIRYGA